MKILFRLLLILICSPVFAQSTSNLGNLPNGQVIGGTTNASIKLRGGHTSGNTLVIGAIDTDDDSITPLATTTAGATPSLNLASGTTLNSIAIVNLSASQALTGKTYNGLTVTTSTGTLTVVNGKTLTVSNTLTFAGTDGSTLNVGTGGTLNAGAVATLGTGVAAAMQNATNSTGGLQIYGSATATKSIVTLVSTFDLSFPFAPADASTYFWGSQLVVTGPDSFSGRMKFYFPYACHIKKAYLWVSSAGTLSSSETSTMSIRVNNTTDTTISSSVTASAANQLFTNISLNIAIAAGDYIEMKWVTPTWVTNPAVVYLQCNLEIQAD